MARVVGLSDVVARLLACLLVGDATPGAYASLKQHATQSSAPSEGRPSL